MKPLKLGQLLELTPPQKYRGMMTGLLMVALINFIVIIWAFVELNINMP